MYSIDYLYQIFGGFENFLYFCAPKRRGARVVEEARLESVYTPKGYPGFESPSLRNRYQKVYFTITTPGFTFLSVKSGVVIVKYFLLLLRCVPKGYIRHNRE